MIPASIVAADQPFLGSSRRTLLRWPLDVLPLSTAQGGVDYIAFPPVLVDFPSLAQFGSTSHTEIRSISLPAVTGEGLERQRDVGQIDGVLVTNPTGSAQIDRFFGDGAGRRSLIHTRVTQPLRRGLSHGVLRPDEIQLLV